MRKVIKVDDQVYQDLDKLRGKGATFSQVIEKLIADRLKVFELLSIMEGQLEFREWQEQKLQEALSK